MQVHSLKDNRKEKKKLIPKEHFTLEVENILNIQNK